LPGGVGRFDDTPTAIWLFNARIKMIEGNTMSDLAKWKVHGAVETLRAEFATWDLNQEYWQPVRHFTLTSFRPDGTLNTVSTQNPDGSIVHSRWLYDHMGRLTESNSWLNNGPIDRAVYFYDASSCLILDLELADVHGLELQRRLGAFESAPPIIFVSGGQDVATTVRAMKAGAVDFLTKPVDTCLLLSAVQSALEKDKRQRKKQRELAVLRVKFESLTPREREVLPLIVGGLLNKQSAGVLEIAQITLQVHRGQVMRKMKAKSLPDLVRIAVRLGIRPYMAGLEADGTGCAGTPPSVRLSLAASTRP
jgi:FixJ family two-component response regulator